MGKRAKRFGLPAMAAFFTAITLFSSSARTQPIKDTSLCQIIEKRGFLTMLQWDVKDRKIFCVVTSQIDSERLEGNTIPFQRLNFYESKNGGFLKIHKFDEMGFMDMFVLNDGNLLTEWYGGSAFHEKVFSVDNKGNIKMVLDEGVKTDPEFIFIDEDTVTVPAILFSSGTVFHKNSNMVEPELTKIFVWDDSSYTLIKSIPWKTRFEALGKMK